MTWNYRVILHQIGENTDDWYYALHEVFYDDDGKPNGWTSDAIDFTCGHDEGVMGLVRSMELALSDVNRRLVLVVRDGKLVRDD